MAAIDDLQLWAPTVINDTVKNTPQRLPIPDNLWDKGYLRLNPVNQQNLNQLYYLITGSILEAPDISFDRDHPIDSVVIFADNATNPANITLFNRGTWVPIDIGLGGTATTYVWQRTA